MVGLWDCSGLGFGGVWSVPIRYPPTASTHEAAYLDIPGRMRIMNDVPSQSDPANDRRLISGVFRIRFPPRYRDGMQRVVRNLLNPTGSTITAKNTITFENDNVLALAA